jgi:hypothetical protein
MRLDSALIVKTVTALKPGGQLLFALAVFSGFLSLPAAAQASCGDYVTIGVGHDGIRHAAEQMGAPNQESDSPKPARAPCSGPECRRNSPAAPMTPPVKGDHVDSRCAGAIFDLAIQPADLIHGQRLEEKSAAMPDPALDGIFHPPR